MEIIDKINNFKTGDTEQNWILNEYLNYENEYIKLITVQTSNKSGGKKVKNGKQWSFIIDIKRDLTFLQKSKMEKDEIGIKLTFVKRGDYKGKFALRLYKMSKNPNNEIVKDILDYIFNN